jgi:hypothetical protein
MFFGFAKKTEKQPKQIEFRFVSVRTEKKFDCFEDNLVLKYHAKEPAKYYGIPTTPRLPIFEQT